MNESQLLAELAKKSGFSKAPGRFYFNAKYIDSINDDYDSGYMFEGDLIEGSNTPVPPGKNRLILVWLVNYDYEVDGQKEKQGFYAVLKLTKSGKVKPIGIYTGEVIGNEWAPLLKEPVLEAMKHLDTTWRNAQFGKK
jgi:hypothetical protein